MKIVEQGLLNRSEPGTRRALSTFPTVTPLRDRTLLATYRVGTTKDSDDETIELRRSSDNGRTWGDPSTPFPSHVAGRTGSLKLAYITPMGGNHLMAALLWVDRETYPGKPLFDVQIEGCLPMAVLVSDSTDLGRTWSPLRVVPVPDDVGPPSLTSPILRLPSGDLALSIETNKNYVDASKWYQRVVYVYSHDGGKTWGAPITVAQDPTGRIFNWDQRGAVCPDGRVVTFTWYYDSETASYLNIRRRISADEGKTWTPPEDLGITDQAAHPAMLPDGGVVLAWVDRYVTHSIRARFAQRVDAPFLPDTEVVLYEHQAPTRANAGPLADTSEALADQGLWTFGLPYAEHLPNGDVLVVYYAGSQDRMDIHWARLSV